MISIEGACRDAAVQACTLNELHESNHAIKSCGITPMLYRKLYVYACWVRAVMPMYLWSHMIWVPSISFHGVSSSYSLAEPAWDFTCSTVLQYCVLYLLLVVFVSWPPSFWGSVSCDCNAAVWHKNVISNTACLWLCAASMLVELPNYQSWELSMRPMGLITHYERPDVARTRHDVWNLYIPGQTKMSVCLCQILHLGLPIMRNAWTG